VADLQMRPRDFRGCAEPFAFLQAARPIHRRACAPEPLSIPTQAVCGVDRGDFGRARISLRAISAPASHHARRGRRRSRVRGAARSTSNWV
jgi:hypothetical protein